MCVRSGVKNLIIYSLFIQQHVCVLWTNAKKVIIEILSLVCQSLCVIFINVLYKLFNHPHPLNLKPPKSIFKGPIEHQKLWDILVFLYCNTSNRQTWTDPAWNASNINYNIKESVPLYTFWFVNVCSIKSLLNKWWNDDL